MIHSDEFLNTAPVGWEQAIAGMSEQELMPLADGLDSHLQRSALAAAYVEARVLGYAHDKAVKRAWGIVAKIRRALGFTYPKGGQFTF